MSLGGSYLAGVGLVAAAAAAAVAAVPADVRGEVGWGAAVGLVLQSPLGWWALRTIGTERFMVVWVVGVLVRFTVVGIAGLVTVPVLGARAAPMLGSMVCVLVALLLIEGVTALREHSREEDR